MWAVGLKGLPMVEPVLVGVLKVGDQVMSKAKGKHQGLGDAARNIGKPLQCKFASGHFGSSPGRLPREPWRMDGQRITDGKKRISFWITAMSKNLFVATTIFAPLSWETTFAHRNKVGRLQN